MDGKTATVVLGLKDLVSDGLKAPQDNIARFGKLATGAFAALGAGAAAGVGLAVKSAADFETAMREVFTLGADPPDMIGPVSSQLNELAARMGVDAVDAAHAMYNTISAGAPNAATALEVIEKSAIMAVAGVTDTDTASRALMRTINAWQLDMSELTNVSDAFFAAMKAGVTTVPELAQGIGQVAGQAAILGVDYQETLGIVSATTKQGAVDTSMAYTQMAAAMTAISKGSTPEMSAALGELARAKGVDAGDTKGLIEAYGGFTNVLQGLRTIADNSGISLEKLFGRVEGAKITAALTGQQFENTNKVLDSVRDSAGATAGAYEIMNEGFQRQVTLLKGQVMASLRELGAQVLPGMTEAVKAVTPVVQSVFGALPGIVERTTAAFRTVRDAALPAAAVLLYAKDAVWNLIQQNPQPWIAGLATVLTVVLVPALGLVATTIWTSVIGALSGLAIAIAPFAPLALFAGVAVGILAFNFLGVRDAVVQFVQGGLAWLQQNFTMLLPLLALVGLTIFTNFVIPLAVSAAQAIAGFAISLATGAVPAVLGFASSLLLGGVVAIGSFAASLVGTAIGAVASFATALLTLGVGGAIQYAGLVLGSMIPANAAAAASFLAGLIPAAVAAGTTLVTSTVPGVLVAANAFLANLIPAAASAAVTFLTQTIPAAAAAAVTFLTTTVPSIAATAASFLVGLIPALVATAVTFFTTTIPAAIATALAFAGMVAGALVAFASMVIGAITAGIGVVIAFLPIILVAAAIGVAIYLLYKNWSSIWGWIVKVTGGAASKITSWLGKAMSWVAGIVKKALSFVWDLFKRAFSSIITIAKTFGSRIYDAVVRAIGALADKVVGIIGRLAEWIGDAFASIVEFVINAVSNLPGADKIISLLGGIGAGISNTLKGLKDRFKSGGEDGGKSFMDGISDVLSGETSFQDFVMDALGMEGLGEIGTGEGAGGAAAQDPLGMWEGTDSQGHWVIDPATGKKVYDSGSVGATRQEANAASAAEREAKKQAKGAKKSGLTDAAGKAATGTMDLAKAFSEAITEAVTVMNDLVAAKLPAEDLYRPQLDKIKQFFIDVGLVFRDLVANAKDSTTVRFEGALDKNDLKRIEKWADPFLLVLDVMDTGIDLMLKLNELKIPELTVFDSLKTFLLRAGQVASDVSAQLDATALTALAPMTEGFAKWLDVLSKAATTAQQLAASEIGPQLTAAVDTVAKFLGDVAARTGAMVSGAQRALGDNLTDALLDSQDLAETFGVWMDTLSKIGAAAESIVKVRGAPASLQAVTDFLMGIAMLTGTFVTGMGRAYPPEARAAVLELSRDLASTFSSWFDALTKLGSTMTALAEAKPIPDGALPKIEALLRDVAWITHRLLVGDGYDLTKNAERSAADFGVARDLFSTLSAGIDALAKAAGMDLSKAARVTEEQLRIAAENARDALNMVIRLAGAYGSMSAEMRDDLFARVKEYASLVGPVVDAITKASNLGLDKAARASKSSLDIAEKNTLDAVAILTRLAGGWAFLNAEFRAEVFAQMKAYAEIVGPAVELVEKAANLGLDEAVRATSGQLGVAADNARDAVAMAMRLANAWVTMDATVREKLFTAVSDYAEMASDAAEMISHVANLGLDKATAATADGLAIAQDNAQAAVAVLLQLTAPWMLMADEARARLFSAVQAYAETAGKAVEAVSEAAGLGEAMASATEIIPDRLSVVQDNTQLAVALVTKLALGWRNLDDETRTKLFAEIEAYSETAGKAVDAVIKAASIGKEVAETTVVPAGTWRIVEENLTESVFALLGVVRTVGTAAMAEARAAAESAAPVLDTIGKAMEIFTMEKIMASPFVAKYKAFSARDPNAYAKTIAGNLQAGIVLMFETLQNALLSIGPVPSEIGAYATALFAAYSPLLDLVEKVNGLNIDLEKIAQLAQVPGLLGDGLGTGPSAPGAGGGGGGMGSLGGLLGNGPLTLTGPVTAVGPMYFQGTQTVEVELEGEVIQRTSRSGYFQSGRSRGSRGSPPA